METIRNYLEAMFANMPNTPEVLRAKDELGSMMEDKYNELLSEGKAENEAVSIVIAEFGNLDELSETLGIGHVMQGYESVERTLITWEQADAYVFQRIRNRFLLGLGVMLIIFSPIGCILADFKGKSEAIAGLLFLFIFLAAGIGLIIYSSVKMNRWDFLDEYPCFIDYATSEHLMSERAANRSSRALFLTIGIILCILSVVPVIIFEEIESTYFLTNGVGPAALLVMVGVGVMLIIFSGGREAAIDRMLGLNDADTVSGRYSSEDKHKVRYANEMLDSIMDSYWSIVTCVYLIWSFLSFNWHYTWIIWPLAAICNSFISGIWGEKASDGKH